MCSGDQKCYNIWKCRPGFPPKHDFIWQCSWHMHLVALSRTNIRSSESTRTVDHFQCSSRFHHRWFQNIYSILFVCSIIIIHKLHVCVALDHISYFAYLLISPLFVSQPLSLLVASWLLHKQENNTVWRPLTGLRIWVCCDQIISENNFHCLLKAGAHERDLFVLLRHLYSLGSLVSLFNQTNLTPHLSHGSLYMRRTTMGVRFQTLKVKMVACA